jgi:cysteinyl-tRNA synthetase
MTDDEKKIVDSFDSYRQKFIDAMDDDVNTADAISAVFELISAINGAGSEPTKEFAEKAMSMLMELCDVLGLLQDNEDDGIDAEIKKLCEEREECRKNRDYARADAIRDECRAKGFILKDTPQGVQIIRADKAED